MEDTNLPIGGGTSSADNAPAGAEATPVSGDGGGTPSNGHDRSEPSTLAGWREERIKAREDDERRASAEAERATKSPEEQEAERRETEPPPPTDDPDLAHLHSQIAELPPEHRAEAFNMLDRAYGKRHEARMAELDANSRSMQMRHDQFLATFEAQTRHVNMVEQRMRADFEREYGVPPTADGLRYLSETLPDRVSEAALAMVTANQQKQEAEAVVAQQQEANAAHLQSVAQAEDYLFQEQVRAADPDLFDQSGRFKPEIGQGVLNYVNSLGIDRDTFKAMLQSNAQVPMRSHKMQQVLLDASRYRAAKAKAAEAVKRPVPPVQRPGLPGGSARTGLESEIAHYENKPGLSLREAAKLSLLRRQR